MAINRGERTSTNSEMLIVNSISKSFGYYVYENEASDRELDRTTFTALYQAGLVIKMQGDATFKFNKVDHLHKIPHRLMN